MKGLMMTGDKGRGRRKGPLSEKSEVLTTRITVETRRALEKNAETSGRSISQEAELLLVQGLHGSDGSLRELDAVLDAVRQIAHRLVASQGGAGLRDSAFVYFGIVSALDWATTALPFPKDDPRFTEVADLDIQIAERRSEFDHAKGRWLDARTDDERDAGLPATEADKIGMEIDTLRDRRRSVVAAISNQRDAAEAHAKDVLREVEP